LGKAETAGHIFMDSKAGPRWAVIGVNVEVVEGGGDSVPEWMKGLRLTCCRCRQLEIGK